MPKRFRLTRRFSTQMTEDGYRRLKSFAEEAALSEEEALSFVFENIAQLLRPDMLEVKLRLFKDGLEERKQ